MTKIMGVFGRRESEEYDAYHNISAKEREALQLLSQALSMAEA